MTKKLLLCISLCFIVFGSRGQTWTHLATDSTNDVFNSSYLDGVSLSYRYDYATDSLYFKIKVATFIVAPFGLNIVLNTTDTTAGPTALWNSAQYGNFSFNRVLSWRTLDGVNAVTNGVANAAGYAQNQYSTNVKNDVINLTTDVQDSAYILAIKRTDISANFSHADVIAAVGSDKLWNDDIPSTEGHGTISFVPNNIHSLQPGDRINIYPNPVTNLLTITGIDNKASFIVTDITGRIWMQGQCTGNKKDINVSQLWQGTYLMYITDSAQSSVIKFNKE